jgi:hypothetical protein
MKYLSIYKKKAADSGVFMEEISKIKNAKWEIEKTIQQHEDPTFLQETTRTPNSRHISLKLY